MKQFDKVYHIEFGKGHVVALTPKGMETLVMCYFPNAKEHDLGQT